MAFIGTLRNKMGTWVVVFVFVAIAAFIAGDIFTGQSSFLMNSNSVGEIGGHDISLEEFQSVVAERELEYKLQTNREPSDREMPTLRQQAWELLILKYAIKPQFAKLGVEVTSEEVWDMIQGQNIDQNVRQAFTNQETGQFDRDRIVSYLKELQNPPPNATEQILSMWQEQKMRWETFQSNLQPGRERIKYENLLIKTNYVTSAEGEREYHNQTDVAEIKYLYIPFYADSSTVVPEAELSDYYNKNKEKFKTKASRSLVYVNFPITPSSADTLEIKQAIERNAAELAQADDDSLYASGATDGQNAYTKYTVATLPSSINTADLQQGKVIGPFIEGSAFKVMKVSKIGKDTVFTARVRHILIKPTDLSSDASKKEAKEKARKILKEIKGGADFAAKARESSEDGGSAGRGGDVGWFSNTGEMVKPFEDAVFGVTKPGLLNDVVETDYGYHIIDVTDAKDNTAYTIAVIEREITPSDLTTNEAYRTAETFAADLSGEAEFKKRANEAGLTSMELKNIDAGARVLGNLGEAREVVRWLFNDASEGKVSPVFDQQDSYVVAVMSGGIEEGYKPLSEVKDEIRPLVLNQVKGKRIIAKIGDSKGSLEEIAQGFGANAGVFNSSDLKPGKNSLPSAGMDPVAIGIAFSLESGKRSKPFIGESGVLVIEMQNKTIAPSVADYTAYKSQIEQNTQTRSSQGIAEAIKENSGIEDERYKFY